MPTSQIYNKIIEIGRVLIDLKLKEWHTEMTLHDKKDKTETTLKAAFKLKTIKKKEKNKKEKRGKNE